MLSPGEFYRTVPKSPEANLRFRKWLLRRCREKKDNRLAVLAACRRDILFFINVFVFQYNPQHEGAEVGPFVTWDFQDEAVFSILEAVEKRHDLVIEKSREMGASWLCILVIVWLSIFHPNKKFLLVSRNKEAVDNGEDPDCLFWKIRFILKHLPQWLSGKVVSREMGILFERSDSRINGQASTGKAGVGGRATAAFLDEFSQIKEDREVLARTADTTKCRIFNFTHKDVGTAAFDLVEMAKKIGIPRRLVMHWTQHPEKKVGLYSAYANGSIKRLDSHVFPADYPFVNDGSPTGGAFPGLRSPWYDNECKRRGSSSAVKMDLDIDPSGASTQFYEPLVIRRLITDCRPADWQGDVFHSPDEARAQQFEMHSEGPLKLWFEPGVTADGRLLHVPSGRYVMGIDVSHGQGATPSCICLFDCNKGFKVAQYTHRFKDPKQFAYTAVALAKVFTDANGDGAFMVWETAGPGTIFGNEVLKEINYRRIYWRTDEFRDTVRESDSPGWQPSRDSKLKVHTDYRSALAGGLFVNYDADALSETLSYIHKDGSVEHPRAFKNPDPASQGNSHGDQVVADALAWMAAKKIGSVKHSKQEQDTPHPNSIAGRRLLNRTIELATADLWEE